MLRLQLLLAQYQDYARDTEAQEPKALGSQWDWEEYLATREVQLEKAAEVCDELLSVIKCGKVLMFDTKRQTRNAEFDTERHLSEEAQQVTPFKGQCKDCKYKNPHPVPPCRHSLWAHMTQPQKDAVLQGVLSCMVRDTEGKQ